MTRRQALLGLSLLLAAGCGGGGSGGDTVLTRANEASFDPDASILAAREVGGYVVPVATTRSLNELLRGLRMAFPETSTIHAYTSYDPHLLHFAIAKTAPWIATWKAGKLDTGIAELDSLLQEFGAQNVLYLNDDGDQAWFSITFNTYLRAHRAAGLFITKSTAIQIVSIVTPAFVASDTDITYEVTTDSPPVTRLTFLSGTTETLYERTGSGAWVKRP